ncbi:hypothetical protein [Litoreibacter roseus]|uniref:Uncharacterized protein n=1 Tax=Litoreibacter roseus TaxID=2601869 RepID=A0A6N6JCU0_9RHOB|nr:hypothetical protein [Litoreibacter roseus]GFE63965.1 hypothetical protein KIN_10390 [Litoreibacter roseus]
MIKALLIFGVVLLAVAVWLNNVPAADAMLVFAAFALGGIWSKNMGHDKE